MFVICADKNKLTIRQHEPITSGSVNVYQAQFKFSPDWDGMERVAVFKAGAESRSVLLDSANTCDIPWEVLAKPNVCLLVGVSGTRDGIEVLPTVWAGMGMILEGVEPGEDTRPPTPDLWRQELAGKGDGLTYDGKSLLLMAGDKPLSAVQIACGGESGPAYQFGHGLTVSGTTVSVNTVSSFSGDNTLPMTAAGVQTVVGNIDALLSTI